MHLMTATFMLKLMPSLNKNDMSCKNSYYISLLLRNVQIVQYVPYEF